jgi:sugar/nucleoside kinase (ribokinase family)
MTGKSFFRVPVYPVEVLDSTGAGDIFMAGLASHLDEGLMWACSIASASSSAVIETHGAEIKCSRNEIIERAEKIREIIKKV